MWDKYSSQRRKILKESLWGAIVGGILLLFAVRGFFSIWGHNNDIVFDAPASTLESYCVDRGFRWKGTSCVFSDGTSCDGGAFYQGVCGEKFTACVQHGGKLSQETQETVISGKAPVKHVFPLCTFSDHSICPERDLAMGLCRQGQHFALKH